MSKYAVVFEKTGTGYSAYIPDLPGCIATGRSLDQAKRLISQAANQHLEAMRRDGDPIPVPSALTGEVEVQTVPSPNDSNLSTARNEYYPSPEMHVDATAVLRTELVRLGLAPT